MFDAIPACTRMSSLGCQRFKSLAAMAPFFAWTSWRSLSEGNSGTVRPSCVLANKTACLIVMSIFLHRLVRSLESQGSSSMAMANLASRAANESASLFIAREFGLCVGIVSGGGVRCVLCMFVHHDVDGVSVAGLRAVWR